MIYSAHCNFLNLARLKLCSWYQTGMIYSQLRRRRCLLFTPINTFFRVMEGKKNVAVHIVKSIWRFHIMKTYFHIMKRLSTILDTHGRVVWRTLVSLLMTSPFSDSIVFAVHTRKQRFQKASFSNRSTLESVFELLCFRWSFSAL